METGDEVIVESPKTKNKTKREKRKRLDVTMEVVHEHPDKLAPLVGYFPSGFSPHVGGGRGSIRTPPAVRVFRHSNRPSRLQVVVSPSDSKVDFVGTNYSGEATSAQLCTYALGVLDKETQTLKIVPIASNKIFRLEPRVGGSDMFDKESSSIAKSELTADQKADRIRDLTNLYGTKKSITRAKKMMVLNQTEDPSAQKDLDQNLETVVINKEALETAATRSSRNIPPYDSSATSPQMAYPLDRIIFKGEWDYLSDVFRLSQEGRRVSSEFYPSFVCNRIFKLKDMEDEKEKETLACILSYITHLIKFKDRYSMDGASSAKHHEVPKILFQKFASMFVDSESKSLSNEKNDLLISYVLVLTLFADEFRTDPTDIAKDLRMTALKLRPHYEHLGCKLKRQNNLLFATLPVPLKFPELRTRRRR